MTDTPIRLAILGAGVWPKEAHLPALAALNTCVLSAVYSRSEATASSLGNAAREVLSLTKPVDVYFEGSAERSLDALLARSDIDGVVIAVPITKQPDLIRRAWAAGKSVASEKPVAGDVETANELYRLFQEKYEPQGLRWQILENFVHEPAYVEARDVVASGAIGKTAFFSYNVCFHVDTDNRFYQTEWRTTPSHAGGFLLDGGVHHAAALQLSLPSPIAQVSAFTSLNYPYLAPFDTMHSIIKLADGTQGTFELSFASSATNVREELVVVGTEGHVKVAATSDGARQAGFTVDVVKSASPSKPESKFFEAKGVELALACFVETLAGRAGKDELERAGAPRAIRDVRFMMATFESEGEVVKI